MNGPIARLAKKPLLHRLTPRPEPQTFRISEPIDIDYMKMMRRAGRPQAELVRWLQNQMIARLAEHLVKNCKAFQFDYERVLREQALHVEVTINDRGTYEGMVDGAERAGRVAGIKEAIEAMPYGMDDCTEFYE